MTGKTHDSEMDSLKADIARLREEFARLASGGNKFSDVHADEPSETAQTAGPAANDNGHGAWADLLHKLDSSRMRGGKVINDLEAEIKKHPLVSIATAFGLGYVIAKLWYQEKKQ
jgi:hypothetical protein